MRKVTLVEEICIIDVSQFLFFDFYFSIKGSQSCESIGITEVIFSIDVSSVPVLYWELFDVAAFFDSKFGLDF